MFKVNNVVIGCDHRSFTVKEYLVTELKKLNVNIIDVGTHSTDSVDYPNYSKAVLNEIDSMHSKGTIDVNGVLLCGSGIGMLIAANKMSSSIRAALIYNEVVAKTCKNHNNANVACFATDHFSKEDILLWLKIYLNAEFEAGRHKNRLDLINNLSC